MEKLVATNGGLLQTRCQRNYQTLETFSTIPEWVSLEHQVATILTQQEIHGWTFNERAAWQLASTLRDELRETEDVLRRDYPYVAGASFTPKRNNKSSGYVKTTGRIEYHEHCGKVIPIIECSFTRLKELNCTS